MCHFPFKYLNVTYSSCAHVNIPNFNMKGEPWCATQVGADGITVKEHKWSLCQDERSLILAGDGKNIIFEFIIYIYVNRNFKLFNSKWLLIIFHIRCWKLLSITFHL